MLLLYRCPNCNTTFEVNVNEDDYDFVPYTFNHTECDNKDESGLSIGYLLQVMDEDIGSSDLNDNIKGWK